MGGMGLRKRVDKFVIAFHTTADAMKMESVCKKNDIGERLIPVPREISAGCGMAWSADPADEAALHELMEKNGIEPQETRICSILV